MNVISGGTYNTREQYIFDFKFLGLLMYKIIWSNFCRKIKIFIVSVTLVIFEVVQSTIAILNNIQLPVYCALL